ncbi:hypothetical protein PTTG_11611 [Puccinia triticina 1-1 BBBD Race 1]|uniref:Uncharacterized protein n=1 Tax=Puccinia triticina (isolate 1-1 / race 1 (BBBD)) TaxID=630390 RepID=A0A180FVS9_PUCT1|nr:hypothetical protein PTTG_11611 [Puccinia triticina 1-1 BBBD Race 1]
MFALNNNPLAELELVGLGVEIMSAPTGAAKFDLSFELTGPPAVPGHRQPLSGVIEYATDLFDHDTVERFATYYLCILGALTADPLRRLSEIDVLDAGSGVGVGCGVVHRAGEALPDGGGVDL